MTKQENDNLMIREISKRDYCNEGFKNGNIKWNTLQRSGVETTHVPNTGQCAHSTCIRTNQRRDGTRYIRALTKIIRFENVKMQKPLRSSNHNQLHFNIRIQIAKQCRRNYEYYIFSTHTHIHIYGVSQENSQPVSTKGIQFWPWWMCSNYIVKVLLVSLC